MILDDVLRELIWCLGEPGNSVIGWEQVRYWPSGAIEIFRKAGWLNATTRAETVECPGCEENCFMPVNMRLAPPGQIAAVFIACDKRSEMGNVSIPPLRLQQWQLAPAQIAIWISTALKLRSKPEKDAASATFKLGTLQGKERLAELYLDLNEPVSLKASGHTLPLNEITFVADGQPGIDRTAILAMVDLPPTPVPKVKESAKKRIEPLCTEQVGLEIGTPRWRNQNARKAANAKHDQPGGSRDKQEQIRAIWATGKFSSRDRCAEEECRALDMSLAAARKALRNTPAP